MPLPAVAHLHGYKQAFTIANEEEEVEENFANFIIP